MQIGDKVENFTLQNQDGKDVSLTDFKGKPVVLFFYPRADTPGCTIESCGFRDAAISGAVEVCPHPIMPGPRPLYSQAAAVSVPSRSA